MSPASLLCSAAGTGVSVSEGDLTGRMGLIRSGEPVSSGGPGENRASFSALAAVSARAARIALIGVCGGGQAEGGLQRPGATVQASLGGARHRGGLASLARTGRARGEGGGGGSRSRGGGGGGGGARRIGAAREGWGYG